MPTIIYRRWPTTDLPTPPFLALTVIDRATPAELSALSDTLFDCPVTHTCSTGFLGRLTEDYLDETYCYRALLAEEPGLPVPSVLLTTAHDTLAKACEFAGLLTQLPTDPVRQLVCLDWTARGVQSEFEALLRAWR